MEVSAGEPDQLTSDAQAEDRAGLDVVTLADHPYSGEQLDAYATLGFVLGTTRRATGVVTVTNLPYRSAPTPTRTVSALSTLSAGRIALGIGAGALWDDIVRLGVEPRSNRQKLGSRGGRPPRFDAVDYASAMRSSSGSTASSGAAPSPRDTTNWRSAARRQCLPQPSTSGYNAPARVITYVFPTSGSP
jgi:hypothetical protein